MKQFENLHLTELTETEAESIKGGMGLLLICFTVGLLWAYYDSQS